eukprot:TRINITY_DN70313_c0_g1_i1.p1 TRINITY_DN70313_c0_g1~~TRINITY_DN70313_c0_g1_i1.p1  ORF type:complete len:1343 (+),score=378.63 TRINITY_DN70313_c0_g1_i1:91-4119(+)
MVMRVAGMREQGALEGSLRSGRSTGSPDRGKRASSPLSSSLHRGDKRPSTSKEAERSAKKMRQSALPPLVTKIEDFHVPDEMAARAEVSQQLAEINERARVAVVTQRRNEAIQNLDRVLSCVLKTYNMDLNRTSRNLAFPDIQETLRLVQNERRGHASQDDYERHLATKLWWLLRELTLATHARELLDEKFSRLNELFSEKEQLRVGTLRKLRDMHIAYRARVQEARRQEQEYQEQISQQENTIKVLRERVAELQQKEMLKRERERKLGLYTGQQNQGLLEATAIEGGSSVEEVRLLRAELDKERAELRRLHGLLQEVKEREKERADRDEAVKSALAALEEDRRKRSEHDKRWEDALQVHGKEAQDREALRGRLREAAQLLAHKHQDAELLRTQLAEQSEALAQLQAVRARELQEHQELAEQLRDQGLEAASILEDQIAEAELARLEAERQQRIERMERDRAVARADMLQRMMIGNPSAMELLQEVRKNGTVMLPQVKDWLSEILRLAADPEVRATPDPVPPPLARPPPAAATAGPAQMPALQWFTTKEEAEHEDDGRLPGNLEQMRTQERQAALRRDYQEAGRIKRLLLDALRVYEEARRAARRRMEAAQHKERLSPTSPTSPMSPTSVLRTAGGGPGLLVEGQDGDLGSCISPKRLETPKPAGAAFAAGGDGGRAAPATPAPKVPALDVASPTTATSPGKGAKDVSSLITHSPQAPPRRAVSALSAAVSVDSAPSPSGLSAPGGADASASPCSSPRGKPGKLQLKHISSANSVGSRGSRDTGTEGKQGKNKPPVSPHALHPGAGGPPGGGGLTAPQRTAGRRPSSRTIASGGPPKSASRQVIRPEVEKASVAVQADYGELVRGRAWDETLDNVLLRMGLNAAEQEIAALKDLNQQMRTQLDAAPLFTDFVSYERLYNTKCAELRNLMQMLSELRSRKDTTEAMVAAARTAGEAERQKAAEVERQIQLLHRELRTARPRSSALKGNWSIEDFRKDLEEEREVMTRATEQYRQQVERLRTELHIEQELREQEQERARDVLIESERLRQDREKLTTAVQGLVVTESDAEQGIMCMHCLGLLQDPVVCTPCGHLMCEPCADELNGVDHHAEHKAARAQGLTGRNVTYPPEEGALFACTECGSNIVQSYVRMPGASGWVSLGQLRRRAVQQLQRALGIKCALRDLGFAPGGSPKRKRDAHEAGRKLLLQGLEEQDALVGAEHQDADVDPDETIQDRLGMFTPVAGDAPNRSAPQEPAAAEEADAPSATPAQQIAQTPRPQQPDVPVTEGSSAEGTMLLGAHPAPEHPQAAAARAEPTAQPVLDLNASFGLGASASLAPETPETDD